MHLLQCTKTKVVFCLELNLGKEGSFPFHKMAAQEEIIVHFLVGFFPLCAEVSFMQLKKGE